MTLKTAKPLLLFTVCATLASSAGIGLSSCGGSSGGGRPGTGGATGTGGSANGGTGGLASGTGGAVGTGGAPACTIPIAATALVCDPGVTLGGALITDFTETTWNNTAGKWGCGLTGGLFDYAGGKPTSQVHTAVNTTSHQLVLSGAVDPGDYSGGGLAFEQCANTSAYTGVQFTLGGTTGGCDVVFQVQTFIEKPKDASPAGGCTTGCYSFPQYKLPATTGVVTVKFADLTGGMPIGAAEIAKQMVGLQWQFQSPAPPPGDAGVQAGCTGIAMTITDVKFVP